MTNAEHRRKHLATPVAELPPLPLSVPRSAVPPEWKDGDIVTLGSKDAPCIEMHTGFAVDPAMRFRLVLTD